MPTPSNAPDPESSRSYPPSTCPDVEVEEASPQSPSSWHPHPPPPYSGDAEAAVGVIESIQLNGGAGPSRSPTTSPWPRSAGTHGQDPESDGMIISRDDSDEGHKQADVDGEMVGASGGPVGDRGVTEETIAHLLSQRRTTQGGSSFRRRLPNIWSLSEEPEIQKSEHTMAGPQRWMEDSGLVGMGCDYSHTRVIPMSLSSTLRPGSRFSGTQQSERQRYDVQVEIKHVDLRESFLCGYLRIQGLTDDHPTLTTYFEGEIIGTKYGFRTQHPSWGATEKEDMGHWGKFTAFRPYQKQARKTGHVPIKDVHQKENIFMRWKEHFLVPDHRVRTINGASFEGFYYICFNQVRGEISGIYFHSKSEKFQQLELKHVEDKGCFGAMEFR